MAGDAHRPLFTPRGIPVRADISLLVIAALVTWSFWSRFIGTFTEAESIAMAVVASALFLLSILAHELAHALEARRRGLIVEDITLYVFGGATRIVSETSRSADEFWLTIVGPWTSIVLGCAFGLVAYGADSAGIRYIAEVAGQLGWLNVLLGAFNLLPGAPLDGGRLLDSVVWRLTGDRSKATAVSTRAGQFLGLAILLLGVAEMLLVEGGFIGGLWLMLIGWFLLRGASAERTMGVIRARLSGLRVSDLIAPVTTVSLGCTVETAADLAFRSGRTDVVVVAGPTGTVGVVTGDALQRVPSERRGWVPVEEVMVPAGSLPTVQCSASAGELLPMLQGGPIVVLDGSDLKSIVTASHLTAALRWLGPSIRGERPAEGQVLTRPATPLVDDRSRSGQAIRLGLWMASGAIVLSSLALVPMPVYDLRPGPALNVPSLLSTKGPSFQPKGQLLLTTVSLSDLSAIGIMRAWLEPHHEIIQRSSLVPSNLTPSENTAAQLQVFRDSTRLAAAVGLRAAGYDVHISGGGALVRAVGSGGRADGRLAPGDIVTAAAGREVVSVADLVQVLQNATPGTDVVLNIARGDQHLRVSVRPGPPNSEGVPVLDIAVEDALPKVTLPFAVQVARSDIGGPSAGLMTALAVYTVTSGDDLTRGRRIAGTGTIDRKGDVGSVGGVAEKVVGAANAGATTFLVPSAQAATARTAAQGHGILVIAIDSFTAAVDRLRN